MPTVLKAFPSEVFVLRAESFGGEVRTYFSAAATAGGILYFWSEKRPLWSDQIVRAGLATASLTDLTAAVRTALAGLAPEPVWPGVANQRPPAPLLKQYNAADAAWNNAAKKALVAALTV